MEYTKPQVDSLGSATGLIEQIHGQKTSPVQDGAVFTNPAYDLDE
jgi:hypothetical protein